MAKPSFSLIPLLLLACTGALAAGQFEPFAGPEPELVWIESSPWATVMGAETPQFVLYDSGQVIYVKSEKNEFTYHSCVLDESQIKALRDKVSAVTQIKSLKEWYSLASATDQPIASFFLRPVVRANPTIVEAYALDFPDRPSRAVAIEKKLHPRNKQDEVPEQIISLDNYLWGFDIPSCPVWQPQYIEVMIWPFKYAKTAPVTWPSDWPGIDSERTIVRHEDSYSIFLDGAKLPELEKLLAPIFKGDGGALLLGGKKWAVAYRPVVPSEPVWRDAFEKVEEDH